MSNCTHCIQLDPFVLHPPCKHTRLQSWGTSAGKPDLMKKSWKYGKGTLVYRAVSYTANISALPLLLCLREKTLL